MIFCEPIQQTMFGEAPPESARAIELDQWFTEDWLADYVVSRVLDYNPHANVFLEPSAGDGSICRAIRRARPLATIIAFELDSRWESDLRDVADTVVICDALNRKWPSCDAVLGNPPFSLNGTNPGVDTEFVARALEATPSVGQVLQTKFVSGQERKRRIWSKHIPAEIKYLSRRPNFLLAGVPVGSPRGDFSVFVWDEKDKSARGGWI